MPWINWHTESSQQLIEKKNRSKEKSTLFWAQDWKTDKTSPSGTDYIFNYGAQHLKGGYVFDFLTLVWTTLRMKSWPLGSNIRFDEESSIDVTTGRPSLYHVMMGLGLPSALQLRVAGLLRATHWSCGCSIISGPENGGFWPRKYKNRQAE